MEQKTEANVELWGALDELNMAWSLGARQVLSELNSLPPVMLTGNESNGGLPNALLGAIHRMLGRDWLVQIVNSSMVEVAWISYFNIPPEEVLQILREDAAAPAFTITTCKF
ncbi:hypothetical protein V6N11_077630 [Hibiscus sabdariffa]|uniref:Uncharacterized protein n=1 Tax=Hibiscus sabdariffa TaxID=183260 RepID=A0ABR2TDT7_9ROSI